MIPWKFLTSFYPVHQGTSHGIGLFMCLRCNVTVQWFLYNKAIAIPLAVRNSKEIIDTTQSKQPFSPEFFLKTSSVITMVLSPPEMLNILSQGIYPKPAFGIYPVSTNIVREKLSQQKILSSGYLVWNNCAKIFTCSPLFLPVPDRRTVSKFHPCRCYNGCANLVQSARTLHLRLFMPLT